MQSSMGKLFVGGISWETNEVRLQEYFKNFGEVMEAVIMKDRTTGRARGFGFVVFADPAVAEKVVMSKHLIDGRMVEAKKIIPRDYHHIIKKTCKNIHGSPCFYQSKKIFVGGLASTVTDLIFRNYFQQFGTINDAVVMYDHSNQRPRGFGFITFDSEDTAEKVLHKAFHELNGKMVEVKIAIPREFSPGPNMRLPLKGLSIGSSPNSIESYSVRMDGGFGQSVVESSNNNNFFGYERVLSSPYSENSRKFVYPMGHSGGNISPSSSFISATHLPGNACFNYSTSCLNSSMILGSESLSGFGNSGLYAAELSSPPSANCVKNRGFSGNIINESYGRSNGYGPISDSLSFSANDYERNYTDSTWLSAFSDFNDCNLLGYGIGASVSDVKPKNGSPSYRDGYTISNKHLNRGVAA